MSSSIIDLSDFADALGALGADLGLQSASDDAMTSANPGTGSTQATACTPFQSSETLDN